MQIEIRKVFIENNCYQFSMYESHVEIRKIPQAMNISFFILGQNCLTYRQKFSSSKKCHRIGSDQKIY